MKVKKKYVETTTVHVVVVIEEELDCPSCQKYTNVKFMYPRDYGTRFICKHCEQDETIFFCMPEDINSLYGDEMSKVGLELSDDGYEVVTV
jgi:hypothetical protein